MINKRILVLLVNLIFVCSESFLVNSEDNHKQNVFLIKTDLSKEKIEELFNKYENTNRDCQMTQSMLKEVNSEEAINAKVTKTERNQEKVDSSVEQREQKNTKAEEKINSKEAKEVEKNIKMNNKNESAEVKQNEKVNKVADKETNDANKKDFKNKKNPNRNNHDQITAAEIIDLLKADENLIEMDNSEEHLMEIKDGVTELKRRAKGHGHQPGINDPYHHPEPYPIQPNPPTNDYNPGNFPGTNNPEPYIGPHHTFEQTTNLKQEQTNLLNVPGEKKISYMRYLELIFILSLFVFLMIFLTQCEMGNKKMVQQMKNHGITDYLLYEQDNENKKVEPTNIRDF